VSDTTAQTSKGSDVSTRFGLIWPELAAALVWLTAFAALVGMPVSHDVIWQLWIARHLNAGVGLYSWIMEVNPPLWYWMAQPIDLLAGATGIHSTDLLVGAMFLIIGTSLALSAALVAEWPTRQRAVLYAGMLLGMLFIGISDFAQREHQALIATIPYGLMMARRVEGKTVAWPLALGVALLATPMIALKHYFVFIPVLLELWLIWHQRRQWRPIRIETVALLVGAVAYGAAVLVFTPEYLTKMVPALRLAYGDLRLGLVRILANRMTLPLAFALLYFWRFRRELLPATQAMLLLTAGFALSYLAQFKGWGYHMDPAVACLLLALCLHLAQRPATPRLRWSEIFVAVLIPALALLPIATEGPYRNEDADDANALLERAEPGMTAAMLTTKAGHIWPMAELRGLKWPLRYYHFWMLQAVAIRERDGIPLDGALLDYVSRVRLETVEDLTCNPPDILIDDRASVDDEGNFNILAFFMQEPKFAAVMASYQAYGEQGSLTAYERIGELPPPSGDCAMLVTNR
jgi:hypothetical protein